MWKHLVVLALCFGIMLVAGCGLLKDNPTGPAATMNSAVADSSAHAIDKPGAMPLAVLYPSWYKELPVSWLPQVPPGDWGNTKNCGQACAVMCDGFFKRYCPSSGAIVAADVWLNARFPGLGYASPNSYYTHFTGRNALGALLVERFGLRYGVTYGSSSNDITRIVEAVYWGRPVIVGVMISGGRLVSSGGVAHWALVVGYDQNYGGQLILNDPGTNSGNKKRISMGDFDATWRTQGRIYAPVWR